MTVLRTREQTLQELEARHEELLELLGDLEQRVAAVLCQYQHPRQVHPGPEVMPGPSDSPSGNQRSASMPAVNR